MNLLYDTTCMKNYLVPIFICDWLYMPLFIIVLVKISWSYKIKTEDNSRRPFRSFPDFNTWIFLAWERRIFCLAYCWTVILVSQFCVCVHVWIWSVSVSTELVNMLLGVLDYFHSFIHCTAYCLIASWLGLASNTFLYIFNRIRS